MPGPACTACPVAVAGCFLFSVVIRMMSEVAMALTWLALVFPPCIGCPQACFQGTDTCFSVLRFDGEFSTPPAPAALTPPAVRNAQYEISRDWPSYVESQVCVSEQEKCMRERCVVARKADLTSTSSEVAVRFTRAHRCTGGSNEPRRRNLFRQRDSKESLHSLFTGATRYIWPAPPPASQPIALPRPAPHHEPMPCEIATRSCAHARTPG